MKKQIIVTVVILSMGAAIAWLAVTCKRQRRAMQSLCGMVGYAAQTHRLLANNVQSTNQQGIVENMGWLLASDSRLADIAVLCDIPEERKSGFMLSAHQSYECLSGTVFQTSPRQERNVDWTTEETIKRSILDDFRKRTAKQE